MHASYILEKQKLFFSSRWWQFIHLMIFFCSTFDWNIRNGNEWYEYTNIPAGQISRLHVELHVLMILFFVWLGGQVITLLPNFFLFLKLSTVELCAYVCVCVCVSTFGRQVDNLCPTTTEDIRPATTTIIIIIDPVRSRQRPRGEFRIHSTASNQ